MKTRAILASGSTLLLAGAVLAQAPQIQNPNQLPKSPRPQVQVRTQSPGTPTAPQSTLAVNGFAAADLRCATDLASATQRLTATLAVQANPAAGNRAQVDVLVDGVSQGAQSLTIRNGTVTIDRTITLRGAQGQHQAVFVLDGVVRSSPHAFSHACVRQTQTRTDAQPGGLTLPNLSFGNVLYAQLRTGPAVVNETASAFGRQEYTVRDPGLRPYHRRLTDIQSMTGAIPLPSPTTCPTEQDAFVTAELVIETDPVRVADPERHVALSAQSTLPARYLDTRERPRFPSGRTPTGTDGEGEPVPQGSQWIVIYPALACTRNGVLEIRFDPENRLRESDEGDNVLRLRYSTVP